MALDLSSVHAKIERAYEHLETLDGEIESWARRYPYGLRSKKRDDGRQEIGFFQIYRGPDDVRFALLTGECVHALRSALDYLIRAVAQERLSTADLEAVEGKLAFPITTDPDLWTHAIKTKKVEGVGPAALAAIERQQPYRAPDPSRDELEVLRLLDDRDKHRLLHTFTAAATAEEIEIVPYPPFTTPGNRIVIYEGPFEHGDNVYCASFSEPGTKLDVKCHLFIQVGIRESPLPEEVRETLPKLGQMVQAIVAEVAEAHSADMTPAQS